MQTDQELTPGPLERIFCCNTARILDVYIRGETLTVKEMMAKTELSERTVRDATMRLRKEKLVTVTDSRGRTFVYGVCDSPRVEKLKAFAFRDGVNNRS